MGASKRGMGCAFMQKVLPEFVQPLYHESLHQQRRKCHDAIEHEALGTTYAIGKFQQGLMASKFIHHVDDLALIYTDK